MDEEDYDEEERGPQQQTSQEIYLSVWQCVGLIVLFVVLQLMTDQILTATGHPAFKDTTWTKIALTSAISGLLTGIAGALLAGFSYEDLFSGRPVSVPALSSVVLAVFGITVISSEAGNLLQRIQPMSQDYIDAMTKLYKQSFGQQLLAISVVAPLTEELIFRGVMLEGLRLHYRTSAAMLVSCALFASLHPYPWPTLIAFLLALFLVWLKIRSGSLVLCMIAHALYNGLPEILGHVFHFQVQGYNTDITKTVPFQPISFDLLGVACLAAGLAGIYISCKPPGADARDGESGIGGTA
jgi:membrane protease YdiL (CAAX protease family)